MGKSVFDREAVMARNVAASFMSDLGGVMHPRVSIAGGQFALLDASGGRYGAPVRLKNTPRGQILTMLAIIVGSNPKKSRVYYAEKYDPSNPAPPLCFSDNGIGPSVNAGEPQARTCGECMFQRWGSDISEASGKKIKACSEKKKLAVLIVGDPTGHVYELQLPPTSLQPMATYAAGVTSQTLPGAGRKADLCDVVTEISFVPGQTGLLAFDVHCLIDACSVDDNGAVTVSRDPQGRLLQAADGGMALGELLDEIWDGDELDEVLGLKDRPFTAPAGFLAPGMQPYMERQPHGGALQRGGMPLADLANTPVMDTTQGPGNGQASPYHPPAGAPGHQPRTLAPLAAPQEAVRSAAVPQDAVQTQVAPAARKRPPRTKAAPLAAPPQVIPPAAAQAQTQAPQGDGLDLPDWMRRSQAPASPGTGGAPSGVTQSFGAGAAPPPDSGVAGALATAFSLPTSQRR